MTASPRSLFNLEFRRLVPVAACTFDYCRSRPNGVESQTMQAATNPRGIHSSTTADPSKVTRHQDLQAELDAVAANDDWQPKLAAVALRWVKAILPDRRDEVPWILKRTPLIMTIAATTILLASAVPLVGKWAAPHVLPYVLPSSWGNSAAKDNLEAAAIVCDLLAAGFLGSSAFTTEISAAVGSWAEETQVRLWQRSEAAASAAAAEVLSCLQALPSAPSRNAKFRERLRWGAQLLSWARDLLGRGNAFGQHYARAWAVFCFAAVLDHMPKKSVGAIAFALFFGGRACKVLKLWIDLAS